MSETVSKPSQPAPPLVERVKNILLKPSPTWDVIADEPADVKGRGRLHCLPNIQVPDAEEGE